MRQSYHIISKESKEKLSEYLAQNSQIMLPMIDLIESSRMAVDELIDVIGRVSIEAVLKLSAQKIAGPKHQGKKGGDVYWYGSQNGRVRLSNRKIRVRKPRLQNKKGGEHKIPAYEAMNAGGEIGNRLVEILMRGVSTRHYEDVIPEMAETVGVKKSSVSREFIEGSNKELERLMNRQFDQIDFLIIYIDGMVFGNHYAINAIGVDTNGKKHVLGICEGASENAETVTGFLEDLVARGIDPGQKYLFVIDGSKALRAAIRKVFGDASPVQRCRSHKIKNVCAKVPKDLLPQIKSVMKASYRLPWQEGISRLKKQASWLENEYPEASASLLEGLEETFTINRLELSPSLRRCLGTTNIIDSPGSGVRMRTRRVSNWQDGKMVLRWAATSFLETEKNFKRIMGHKDLWMLKARLRDKIGIDNERKVG